MLAVSARIAVRAFSTTPTAIIAGAGESTGAAIAKHFASKGLCVHGARRRPAADAPIPPALVELVRGGRLPRRGGRRGLRRGRRGARAGRARRAQHRRERPILRRGYERARLPQNGMLAALSALHFAHALGPRMAARGRGTLIFAGATASVRGGAGFAASGGGDARKRALAQDGHERELGPRGVHVAHVVIDGPVDTPFVRERIGEAEAVRMAERGALIEQFTRTCACARCREGRSTPSRARRPHRRYDLRPGCNAPRCGRFQWCDDRRRRRRCNGAPRRPRAFGSHSFTRHPSPDRPRESGTRV